MMPRSRALACLLAIAPVSVAMADVPQVATDIPPVHSLAAQVMGDLGTPDLILRPGASPHGYAMRPSEAQALSEADVVFWVGGALTPWLDEAIESLASEAASVELLEAEGTTVLPFREGATFEAHDHAEDDHHEHDHDDHEDEHGDHDSDHDDDEHADEHADHGSAEYDPHAWLDPDNAKAWLDAMVAELSRVDPDNAAVYAANARTAKADIDAAAAQAEVLLAPAKDLRFVVFHDAYHYYESHFGLNAAGAISLGDAASPAPRRIEQIRETIKRLDVQCVFGEPQFDEGLVRTAFDGTQAHSGVLDPMGSDIAPGPGFYPRLIVSLAESIRACNDAH